MNQIVYRRYRRVRYVFWISFIGAFVLLLPGRHDISLYLFICAFLSSMVSVGMPCPYCGKTIGYRYLGIFVAANCFGGWCIHCGSRLFFLKNRRKDIGET